MSGSGGEAAAGAGTAATPFERLGGEAPVRALVDSAMFPAWATDYMSAIEATLGEAYSGPADDVRGYLASIKSPLG